MEQSIFVATPLHDGKVHQGYMAGALQAMATFAGRIALETQMGSFLPRNRDMLTQRFLDSSASHVLWVDSDIGWTPEDAQKLLDSGKDFVSGVYCKKQPDRKIPASLTGNREGDLWEANYVPAGFLLIARNVMERMIGAYQELEYEPVPGQRAWAIWAWLFEPGVSYDQEDVALCRRWKRIGGQIWLHQGVIVKHYGELAYVPDGIAT